MHCSHPSHSQSKLTQDQAGALLPPIIASSRHRSLFLPIASCRLLSLLSLFITRHSFHSLLPSTFFAAILLPVKVRLEAYRHTGYWFNKVHIDTPIPDAPPPLVRICDHSFACTLPPMPWLRTFIFYGAGGQMPEPYSGMDNVLCHPTNQRK
jgi:hypothetical protein